MKWVQTFQVAVKTVGKRLILNFLLILLVSFLLFMAFMITATMTGAYVGKLSAERKTGKKFSQMGVLLVDVNVEWDRKLADFFIKLCIEGLVDGVGGYSEAGMQDAGLKPLLQLQNESGVKSGTRYNEITLMGYFTDNLSLFEGDCRLDRELMGKYDSEEDILLIVGDLFKEIPLGTVIQSEIVPERQYIIVGYMPHDYHYFIQEPFHDDSVINASLENPMDNRVIYLIQEEAYIESTVQVFYKKDGITDEVLSQIQEKADQEGIGVSLIKLETAYERNSRRTKNESALAFPYLVAMFLSVCMIALSGQLLQIIGNDGKKYGIYYAVGFSDKDIHLELAFENAFRLLAGMVIATIGFIAVLKSVFADPFVNADSRSLLFSISFGGALLAALLFGIITTEIPWRMIKSKTPAELMRGRE